MFIAQRIRGIKQIAEKWYYPPPIARTETNEELNNGKAFEIRARCLQHATL
jgi:hypothetical protein